MYWSQTEAPQDVAVPDDVVDLLFALEGQRLPVDHAHALAVALVGVLPWLADEPAVGIHAVHVAGSQNGWERPAHHPDNYLEISRRTRLTVRAPQARVRELLATIPGARLRVGDCDLTLGAGKVRPLSKEKTLFARYLVAPTVVGAEPPGGVSAVGGAAGGTVPEPGADAGADEARFLEWAAQALGRLEVGVRKALCGRVVYLTTPTGPLLARSLLLADLSISESLRLQQAGLGPHRLLGCGIFIPHKGIDPVHPPG